MKTQIRTALANLLPTLKKYVVDNWGLPFILAFVIFLAAAAVLLVAGNAEAEASANLAYFSLLIGVILEIVCFSWNRRNRKAAESSSNTQALISN